MTTTDGRVAKLQKLRARLNCHFWAKDKVRYGQIEFSTSGKVLISTFPSSILLEPTYFTIYISHGMSTLYIIEDVPRFGTSPTLN